MKPNLRVWFTDFWPEWNKENFILPILSEHYNVLLDASNPDVLFHSIFNGMRDTPNYKCKKILYLGENYRPERFGSDYSISFDPESDTNFRLPLWQVYLLLNPELKERLYNRKTSTNSFDHWCGMVVSNPGNFFRNSLFEMLNAYRPVKSYGRYRNNDQRLIQASEGKYWREAKLEFFDKIGHEFMLAIENSPYRYYCTEKLMDAFLSGSLPIYWGDPRVGEDFNEKAFINGTKIDVLEAVKKIDKDSALYMAMQNEPVFTDEQKEKLENNLSHFEEWLINKINV